MSLGRANRNETVKILFAGGCHVLDFIVGEKDSFPAYAAERLSEMGIESEIYRLPHVKLSHRQKLANACMEIRPEILVLQLGHFELSQSLAQYFKKRFGYRQASGSSDSTASPSPLPSVKAFRFRARLKWLADCCLGHPLADLDQIDSLLNALLESLHRLEIPAIFLLSPLPCTDRTRLYYRQQARPLFSEAAARHQCEFVDVLPLTDTSPLERFGEAEFHYDGMHLGKRGHHALGQAVAAVVQRAVQMNSLRECSR